MGGSSFGSEQPSASAVDEENARRLAAIFKALSDPTRVRIVAALLGGERCVGDIAVEAEVSHSAASHQLRLLRRLRLVRDRKEGRRVYYALDDEHVVLLFRQGLDHVLHL